MDISFENRDLTIYTEYSHQTKRIQESAECVVPDTDADIDKIAGVMSEIYLKSKDLSARGVLISGEVSASVFYITDKKESVSSLTIRKPFSVEYEVDAPESETLAQITLLIQGTDIRLVNPRKIAAGFEIEGDLSCYHSEKLRVESRLPENAPGLHARVEEQELTLKLLRDVEIIGEGGASFRFIVGRYGSGKSFLLQTIRNNVMEKGFVVMIRILQNYGPLLVRAMGYTLLLALCGLFFACVASGLFFCSALSGAVAFSLLCFLLSLFLKILDIVLSFLICHLH